MYQNQSKSHDQSRKEENMIFNKSLSEVDYKDIESLKTNIVAESEILDYKKEMIDDNKLIKHVDAFVNSSGGDLVFGVEETGRGGYPKDIVGIDSSINLEKLEQVILGNIHPRINVQFSKKISVPNTNKIVLIIRIPQGIRPHMTKSGLYYKRYNFEATPMSEIEVEALYRNRFFGTQRIDRYIAEIISNYKNRLPKELEAKNMELIVGNIFVTPTNIDNRIFDNLKILKILGQLDGTYINNTYLPYINKHGMSTQNDKFQPSKYGIILKYDINYNIYNIEMHRNGLIHHINGYGDNLHPTDAPKKIYIDVLNYRLLQTLLFANDIYSKINFYDKIKIILSVDNVQGSCIVNTINCPNNTKRHGVERMPLTDKKACSVESIYVERELYPWEIEKNYLKIGKNIMDEVVNCFGMWEAHMYDENGDVSQIEDKYSIQRLNM